MAYVKTKDKKAIKKKLLSKEIQDNQECLDKIKVRMKEGRDFIQPYITKWQDYYQIYRCIVNDKYRSYYGRTKLFVPLGRSIVDSYYAKLTINKPKFLVVPRNPENLSGSKSLNRIIDYYWDKNNFKKKYKLWVKDSLQNGVGVARLTWKKDIGPNIEILNLAEGKLLLDPTATDTDKIRWYTYTYERDKDDILNDPNYTIPDDVEINDVTAPQYDYYENFRLFIAGKNPGKDTTFNKGEITEYVGLYEDEKGHLKNYLIVILNKEYIIRKELWSSIYKHDKINIHFISNILLPHELMAASEIEAIESLQYELNDVRNQRMDNVTNNLHQMWKVSYGADIDESELIWQPGGIVHTADMNGLVPLQVPDMTATAYNEETMIKADAQMISGLDDATPNLGKQNRDASGNTARGLALQMEETNAIVGTKLDNIEDGVVSLGRQMIQVIQQFMPDTMVIRIAGEEGLKFVKVSKEEVKGEYDFSAEMGTTQPQNKLTRRAEARELVAAIGPYLQVAGPETMPKFKKALDYLIETYDIPESENEDEMMQQPMMPGQPGQPQQNMQNPILTPSQTGVPLEGMQQMYGEQGANLGGAPNLM